MFISVALRKMPCVMKTFGWIQLVMVMCGLIVGGCASAGYQKSDAAADSLQDAAAEVEAEKIAIDATIATLNDLINNPATDLKPQFDRYNIALNRLIDVEHRNEKAADRASRKSVAYFETWDKELDGMEYQAVRDQSAARKNEVKSRFNAVNSRYRETQQVVQPLISYCEDIRLALSTDLTLGGLQSVKTVAANAQQGAQKVQSALAQLSDALAESGAQMSSTAPVPTEGPQNAQAVGASDGPVSESQHAEVRQ